MSRWRPDADRARLDDRLLVVAARVSAAASAGIVLLIGGFLLVESLPALRALGVAPFAGMSWHPTGGTDGGQFGLMPMLVGTLAAGGGAVALATPLALLAAVVCVFLAPPRIALLLGRVIELLAGIPSVVYGFWGLVVLVPLIRRLEPPGPSLLAGILVLALMILPTLALAADAALRAVPRELLTAASALGLSRTTTLVGVALPAARSGLWTGLLLGVGRALGETMAVLMVCGNVVQVPGTVFDPVRTLTANIALEMAYALDLHRAALFVSGLVLALLVTVLVLAAQATTAGSEAHP
ncbi:MAG: phosphate ABC transporter permease subunit PstC [Acidobacteriota bacterium]